jgi:hypothetical protein
MRLAFLQYLFGILLLILCIQAVSELIKSEPRKGAIDIHGGPK